MMTAKKLRDDFVATALAEVGYTTGNYNVSKYGVAKNWRSPWLWGTEWQGLYCNRNLSWDIDQTMGAKAGIVAVGRQSGTALPVGFAATWLQREWFRANDCHVGFANSQPGDYYLFKLPGRQANATNHVGIFYKWHVPGKIAITIEGNLRKPGSSSNSTIGVHLHHREITYVVGVYRPRWAAAAVVYNQEFPPKNNPPKNEIGDSDMEKILAAIEKLGIVNLSEKTMELLHTGRSSWALGDYLNLIGNRVGRTEDYVLSTKAEIAGVKEAVMQISEAAGMNRRDVEKIVAQKIANSKFTLELDEG